MDFIARIVNHVSYSIASMKPQMTASPPFKQNRLLQGLVAWLVLLWCITAISPFNRLDWLLENLLVLLYGTLLIVSYPKFQFSNSSYVLFTIFLTLHLIGAHYTYTETPPGYWAKDLFDLERNHYDRLAHFAYGLLCGYPLREVLLRLARVVVGWSYFLTVSLVLAFSGFYEVMEMMVAMIVSPETGDAYLGTQGDIWDAQRDMSLAFSGAVSAMLILWLKGRA